MKHPLQVKTNLHVLLQHNLIFLQISLQVNFSQVCIKFRWKPHRKQCVWVSYAFDGVIWCVAGPISGLVLNVWFQLHSQGIAPSKNKHHFVLNLYPEYQKESGKAAKPLIPVFRSTFTLHSSVRIQGCLPEGVWAGFMVCWFTTYPKFWLFLWSTFHSWQQLTKWYWLL